jgi:cyclic pyranopterin phosphate synthase
MSQLIDHFGRTIEYLRLSVTDRCDFRCFYCIPKGFKEFADPEQRLTLEELERLVRIFSELGVRRVRLTGGEPLLRKDLVEMVRRFKRLPGIEDLSLSTNASRLAEYAPRLKAAGISRINVSLDTLNPEVFREITGSDLDPVLCGLRAAKAAGFRPIKINMVVMRDLNLGEVGDMAEFCRKHGFTLRFIETMPVGEGGRSAQSRYVSLQEVRSVLEQRFELEPARMSGAGPARYLKLKEGRLKMGFITPMSQHFCDTCNRVRLSAEGTIYLCLGQEDRLELRPLLRLGATDRELTEAIVEAVRNKPRTHQFNGGSVPLARLMSTTGG